jgi:hypothetical protein
MRRNELFGNPKGQASLEDRPSKVYWGLEVAMAGSKLTLSKGLLLHVLQA